MLSHIVSLLTDKHNRTPPEYFYQSKTAIIVLLPHQKHINSIIHKQTLSFNCFLWFGESISSSHRIRCENIAYMLFSVVGGGVERN